MIGESTNNIPNSKTCLSEFLQLHYAKVALNSTFIQLTFCVSEFGSQLWLMNLESFPLSVASTTVSPRSAMKYWWLYLSRAYSLRRRQNSRMSRTWQRGGKTSHWRASKIRGNLD